MSIVTIRLTKVQREALRQRALDQLTDARDQALALFVDGRITLDELQDTTALLLRGATRIGEQLVDEAVKLPEPIETLSNHGLNVVLDLVRERVDDLVAKVIAWAHDAIGPNPRRLLRRIDQLERDDLEDGIVGDDRVRKMYRLAARLVRKFPASAESGGIAFIERQLYLDGLAWGTPPERFQPEGR